jgi:hypothetical protein
MGALSTVSLDSTLSLLKDIYECAYVMNVRSNSGVRGRSMQGEFPNLGTGLGFNQISEASCSISPKLANGLEMQLHSHIV